jgi:cephalosporin-C deacetylase-like acetyl esterase
MAIVAPEQIKPSSPRPDDFDIFWQSKIEELAKVPANPQLGKK